MNPSAVIAIVIIGLCVLGTCARLSHDEGERRGACTELCRPAAFDSDQRVNGGCLCIGSDKVLRIKGAP